MILDIIYAAAFWIVMATITLFMFGAAVTDKFNNKDE